MKVWELSAKGFLKKDMLKGKKIIIGISGGIAAYKTIGLIRLFKKHHAEVRTVLTPNALHFVTRTTLESVTQHKVYAEMFSENNDYTTEHVSLTDWGDVFIVAPATANIIGKYAAGIADCALSTSLLAFDRKVYLAPAMNCKMWAHPTVQKNCEALRQSGAGIIEPESGFLACGYEGKGRMAEPEAIFDYVLNDFFSNDLLFKDKRVLVTAGPTHEAIDPVRFIGNHSTGLMGYSIAEAFAGKGAKVTLVSGPTSLAARHPGITTLSVVSADDMYKACIKEYAQNDIIIMAAAVADYRPIHKASSKIKKDNNALLSLQLEPTPDILSALGKLKKKGQILVGFALETDNELAHATEKLKRKNLDFIVMNSLRDKGAGFGTSTNKVTIVDKKGVVKYDLKSKSEVASDIVAKTYEHLQSQTIKKRK